MLSLFLIYFFFSLYTFLLNSFFHFFHSLIFPSTCDFSLYTSFFSFFLFLYSIFFTYTSPIPFYFLEFFFKISGCLSPTLMTFSISSLNVHIFDFISQSSYLAIQVFRICTYCLFICKNYNSIFLLPSWKVFKKSR